VPERSRSPQGPRHLAPGGQLPPWWHALDTRRLRIAIGASLLALPLLVLDNLPERTRGTAEAVETVAPSTTEAPATTEPTTATTLPATTMAPSTTAPPTTAPATTAPPTTAPPTTRPPATVRQATPTTAPPTTAPPTTTPPPPAGSVEAIIHAHFGAAGEQAVVIARCESGLNPSAIGGGGRYYGLFQLGRDGHAAAFTRVTGRAFDEAWSDPNANAQYAAWLYGQSGWSAWGCRSEL
jgi:hypothetical protein